MLKANTEQARFNMIAQQIRPWDVVDDRVLKALKHIPRERFVPDSHRGLAFADIDIPLAHGQFMMSPKVEARMLQALDVRPGSRVLEIGTGSGFVTACLAHLGGTVTSLDIHADFTAQAGERLAALGLKAQLLTQDALSKLPEPGNWDVIAITGSLAALANNFKNALAENGRLFVVTGQPPAMEARRVIRMPSGAFQEEVLFETVLPRLENAPERDRFIF